MVCYLETDDDPVECLWVRTRGQSNTGDVVGVYYRQPHHTSSRGHSELFLKAHGGQIGSCRLEESRCPSRLQKRQTRELEAGQPHLGPWESGGTNKPGNHSQA